MMSALPPEMMLAAQGLTGATIAAWLLAGFLPGQGRRLRVIVLAIYLIAAASLIGYVTLK